MTIHPHGVHKCYCPSDGYEVEVEANVKCNTLYCPIDGTRLRAVEAGAVLSSGRYSVPV